MGNVYFRGLRGSFQLSLYRQNLGFWTPCNRKVGKQRFVGLISLPSNTAQAFLETKQTAGKGLLVQMDGF